MTEHAIAANATALRNLAARLERMGYTGDAHAEAEHIALNLLADGYRPLDKPVPARGPGAKRESIEECRRATEAAVRTAKDRRKQP
ncbi:MAG: hypothetical protein JWO67_2238 [Streptosporangiaceae bacterium]|nr:hypothetical protein [Streptosporangiaceae bacterium]